MKNKSLNLPWAKIDSFVGSHTSSALTVYRPCPICGELHYRTLLVFNDFQFYSDSAEQPKRARIQEVQCQSCHAIYLNPCYTTAGFGYLFAEAGQSYGSTEGRPQEQIDWMDARGLLDEGKVFLDAGCYEGRFLSGLPKSIRRIGIDIDAPAIARGKERYSSDGVELIHGAFETFQCPVEPDVISMFHVLEHLANPAEVLCHLRLISHDKTQLIIEVPVLEFGHTNDINGFLSVQHMTHFSLCSLGQLMNRTGWDVLESQQMTGYNGHRILAKPTKAAGCVVGNIFDKVAVQEYFGNWYYGLAELGRKMEDWPEVSTILLWGGGAHSEFLYQVTPLFQINRKCKYLIVDSDELKQGESWRGISICSPKILGGINWGDCLLVISSYGSQDGIFSAALDIGVPRKKIKILYEEINRY